MRKSLERENWNLFSDLNPIICLPNEVSNLISHLRPCPMTSLYHRRESSLHFSGRLWIITSGHLHLIKILSELSLNQRHIKLGPSPLCSLDTFFSFAFGYSLCAFWHWWHCHLARRSPGLRAVPVFYRSTFIDLCSHFRAQGLFSFCLDFDSHHSTSSYFFFVT